MVRLRSVRLPILPGLNTFDLLFSTGFGIVATSSTQVFYQILIWLFCMNKRVILQNSLSPCFVFSVKHNQTITDYQSDQRHHYGFKNPKQIVISHCTNSSDNDPLKCRQSKNIAVKTITEAAKTPVYSRFFVLSSGIIKYSTNRYPRIE